MYAIVEIAGFQYKVESGQHLHVNRLAGAEGDKLSFDKVLLVDDGGAVRVGTPTVASSAVSATIVAHDRDKKVIVFKKKRRKGYKVKNGHRQPLTLIKIDGIA